jgi:FKBP12-rapamycin complex-associated protein
VLERHAGSAPANAYKHLITGSLACGAAAAVWHTRVVERVVGRLLSVAVADPSERVRLEVLRALAATTALDEYLAQADALRALLMGMNDESCSVRALALSLVGRLAARNPAHANPALRRHLQQLLADMEHSPDSRAREGECVVV